jgi:hypothetical protein
MLPPTADEVTPPVATLLLDLPPVLASGLVDAPPLELVEPPAPGLLVLEPSLLELEHAGSATTTAAQKRIVLFIFVHPQACVVNRFQIVASRIAGFKEELLALTAALSRTGNYRET